MKFEEYLGEQIRRIASGDSDVDLDFKDTLDVYLALIYRGMSPSRAKAILSLYVQ